MNRVQAVRLRAGLGALAACIPLLGAVPPAAAAAAGAAGLEAAAAARFAQLALDCVHQEYPNKISHVLAGDADVRPPRELAPAFYGCFD